MPCVAREADVVGAVGFVARFEELEVHRVGDVEQRLAVLDRAHLLVVGVPLAQLGQRLHRRGGAEGGEPLVEIALHAVGEIDRALLALHVVHVGADAPEEVVVGGVLVDDAGDVGGIDDDRALRFEDVDRVIHRLGLLGIESAARRGRAGRRELVVEAGARDADARAFQAVLFQELRVVVIRRRRAARRGGIVRIGIVAFEDAEEDRGVGDELRHRAGACPDRR